jgi:Coenzyme PQQ synthesis protein D (PqqD)
MTPSVTLDTVCAPSDDVVAREIEGEVIIVPLTGGIGDIEGEAYTLNDTGRAIWRHLDGVRTLREVATSLLADYEAPQSELEADVVGFAAQMVQRRILAVRS